MKKYISSVLILSILLLLLLLTSCDVNSLEKNSEKLIETEEAETDEQEKNNEEYFGYYTILNRDNNTAYLDYTADYNFSKLLRKGVKSNKELASYVAKKHPKVDIDFDNIGYGCSAFSVSDKSSAVYGRNFDIPKKEAGVNIILKTSPKNGYSSISTVNLGFIGIKNIDDLDRKTVISEIENETSPLIFAPYLPLDGMNEKGLTISILQLNYPEIHENEKTKKYNLTSTTMIRYILDNAADVNEAIELFENVNLHTDGYAYHYLIADKKGKSAVIEYADNTLIIKKEHHTSIANMLITEDALDFYGDNPSSESYTRMEKIDKILRKHKKNISDIENAIEAIEAGTWKNTRYSIVFDISNNNIYYALGGDFDTVYMFENIFDDNIYSDSTLPYTEIKK